jgi:hypothetical protein
MAYRYIDLVGVWPMGERWEGFTTVEEYFPVIASIAVRARRGKWSAHPGGHDHIGACVSQLTRKRFQHAAPNRLVFLATRV